MKRSMLIALGLLLALHAPSIGTVTAQHRETKEESDRLVALREKSEGLRAELIALRRDLHRHPELSGQEERTAGIIAQRLRDLGLEVRTGLGGHGVLGVLRGGREGPTVAYRADMDAVRSAVIGDVPYRSQVEGVKHVCGHDVHVAVGVGVASVLASLREEVPGTVMFIFQPAEETLTGARAMLADGILDDPTPQAIFAVHTAPLPVGTLGVGPGVGLPGTDRFTISLKAKTELETLVSEALGAVRAINTVPPPDDPAGNAVLAGITTKGGPFEEFIFLQAWLDSASNTSEKHIIRGVVKASDADAYARARRRIMQVTDSLATDDAEVAVAFEEPRFPDMHSNAELARAAVPPIEAALGEGSVTMLYASVPYFGEDFALFLERIPGAMFFLGAANPERGITARNHSPDYDVDEEAIVVGTKAMSNVLLDFLERGRQ